MTKDDLRAYKTLKFEERQLCEQLEIWEARAASVGTVLDGMPRGGRMSDPTARYALKLCDIRDMIVRKREEIAEAMIRIELAVESLQNPSHRFVMREYYINDRSSEEIADILSYSVRQVWRLHEQALKKMSVNVSE